MTDPSIEKDTQFIHRTINAAAIRGIMEDQRWEYIVSAILNRMRAAQARVQNAQRAPSMDGMIQLTHYQGQVRALEDLLRMFSMMYDSAGKVLDEAKTKLPYAPQPTGKP